MTSPVVSSVQYRTPRAFVQFIGESDEVYNLSPEHILSVQTSKSVSSPAGAFEIVFKGGAERTSNYSGPVDSRPATQEFDWWLKRLHPMTLAIIVLSSNDDMRVVQRVFTPATPGTGTARPAAQVPREFMAGLADPDRAALQRSVVMVGLVEDCSLSMSMTSTGPQRALRVTGRDMGKILLDDNLTRLARSVPVTREQETRMITIGNNVPDDEWKRFMDRASINGQTNGQFWRTLSVLGSDSKLPLLEAITNIVNRAPSYNIRLSNSRVLKDYFDVGAVRVVSDTLADYTTSRVAMSDELKLMSVRATMQLFTYSGPVYNALASFAPPPLAEMFVETVGLEARLVVRRPPFYRPASMPNILGSMDDFMQKVARSQADRTALRRAFSPYLNNTTDEFVTSDPRGRNGERGLCHTADAFQVIGYNVTRSMANAVSMYQIYPTILMRGEASEAALQQGVISYLYDIPAAQRYGTTRTYKFGCPWDVMAAQVSLGPGQGARSVTRQSDYRWNEDQKANVLWRPSTSSTEISLAAAETMRQYFYNRDNPGMLSGQITVIGDPNYRVGDRIHLPDYDDYVFYIDAVQQNYQYGRSYLTTLSVSRGQPYSLDRRLVPYPDDLTPNLRLETQRERTPPTERR